MSAGARRQVAGMSFMGKSYLDIAPPLMTYEDVTPLVPFNVFVKNVR
jgi:hypothetical protein